MIPIAHDPIYCHPLPEGHRFPMSKYELIPAQLLHEGLVTQANFFSPRAYLNQDKLLTYVYRAHQREYVEKLQQLALSYKEQRTIGFPLTAKLVEREFIITQGTLTGSERALQTGVAFNVAGGTHHAYPDRGEGFCLLNDVAVGSYYLLDNKLASKILIVDLDVHQGNGTAVIFQNESRVFTFSMHGATNYPLRKEVSDLDIPLPNGTDDDTYLNLLHSTLPKLIEQEKPDFLYYISGVDVLATDKLGKLGMSREGCRLRDRFVFEVAKNNQIPMFVSMGGGYSVRLADIVEAHANTYREAFRIYA